MNGSSFDLKWTSIAWRTLWCKNSVFWWCIWYLLGAFNIFIFITIEWVLSSLGRCFQYFGNVDCCSLRPRPGHHGMYLEHSSRTRKWPWDVSVQNLDGINSWIDTFGCIIDLSKCLCTVPSWNLTPEPAFAEHKHKLWKMMFPKGSMTNIIIPNCASGIHVVKSTCSLSDYSVNP